MDDSERRRIVEAVILGSPEPISAQRVAAVIPYCKPAKVKVLVEDLNAECRFFGFDQLSRHFQNASGENI